MVCAFSWRIIPKAIKIKTLWKSWNYQLDLLRLVEAARRSTSGARLVIEADYAPGLPWVDPGRYAAVVDLGNAGNMRHGDTVVAQEETMRSHTGAPGGDESDASRVRCGFRQQSGEQHMSSWGLTIV